MRHRRAGFSLVEVLVAMVLLIVAAVWMTSYTLATTASRRIAQQRSYALVAAREVVDSIRRLGFTGATNTATPLQLQTRTVGGVPLTVRVQVEVASDNAALKAVAVTVSNNRGTELQQLLTTLYNESQ